MYRNQGTINLSILYQRLAPKKLVLISFPDLDTARSVRVKKMVIWMSEFCPHLI